MVSLFSFLVFSPWLPVPLAVTARWPCWVRGVLTLLRACFPGSGLGGKGGCLPCGQSGAWPVLCCMHLSVQTPPQSVWSLSETLQPRVAGGVGRGVASCLDLLAEQPVGVPELHCSSSCRLDSPGDQGKCVALWPQATGEQMSLFSHRAVLMGTET